MASSLFGSLVGSDSGSPATAIRRELGNETASCASPSDVIYSIAARVLNRLPAAAHVSLPTRNVRPAPSAATKSFARAEPVVLALPSPPPPTPRASAAVRWSSRALVVATWLSGAIFGAYILVHYGGAIVTGDLHDWNARLGGLYDPATPLATIGIGLHFAAGGILLLVGPLQFLAPIRARMPAVHRWVGRLYTVAAMLVGAGGLVYLVAHRAIGGTPMSIGFGLYGAAVVLAGAQTLRHARARNLASHRAWAIRLYALTVGSWLYRMDYGFWVLLADGAGHTRSFDGAFDLVMDFFFYVPNLAIAELIIRGRARHAGKSLRHVAVVAVTLATVVVLVGTYFFARYEWGPAIAARFSSPS
jgi:hypothetical protein